VTVGDERAHAEFRGQRHGLPIMAFGLLDRSGIGVGRDFAEKAEHPRLMSTLFVDCKNEGRVQSIAPERPLRRVLLSLPRLQ
jgi:hypothetical protein